MSRDPRVDAFLARFAVSERESAEADVADGMPVVVAERVERLIAACRLGVALAQASPDPERAMAWQDPPHPSYAEVMARLRQKAADEGWRFTPQGTISDQRVVIEDDVSQGRRHRPTAGMEPGR